MKKFVIGFFVGFMAITTVAIAATFNTWEELEVAVKNIAQVKKAQINGDTAFVLKIEGDLLGLPVRYCRIDFPSDVNVVPDVFTPFRDHEQTNPPRYPFADIEHLCWQVFNTATIGAATSKIAYDTISNTWNVLSDPSNRCGAQAPGWPNGWRYVNTDLTVVAFCEEQISVGG